MSNQDEVVKVLKRARKILSTPGAWTQQSFMGEAKAGEGYGGLCFCWLGSIRAAAIERDKGRKLYQLPLSEVEEAMEQVAFGETTLEQAAVDLLPVGDGYGVISFNDHPARKQEEVVAMFDVVIKKLEKGMLSDGTAG